MRPYPFPEYLRPRDVAALVSVDPQTIYKWIRSGRLPAYRVGRLVRVPRSAVANLVRQYHIESAD